MTSGADDPFFSPELFDVQIADGQGDLRYGDELVSVVTVADAASESLTMDECAARRLAR